MEPTQTVTNIISFLSNRTPAEYSLLTGWVMSELLGMAKSTRIKSVLGLAKVVVMALYKAIKEIELFEQSAQGQAIIAEVKQVVAPIEAPKQ